MDAAARGAVRRYLRRVGPALRRTFGKSNFYSVEQVRETIKSVALQETHLEWACSLYCSAQEFEAARAVTRCKGDYAEMRLQSAVFFFGGDRDFDPYDLKSAQGIGGPVKDQLGDASNQIGGENPGSRVRGYGSIFPP